MRTANELTITLLYIYRNELDLECFRNGIVVVEERGLIVVDVSYYIIIHQYFPVEYQIFW